MHRLATTIERRIETLAAVNVDIERARGTLAQLRETTWGVRLREIGVGGRERFPARLSGTGRSQVPSTLASRRA